MNTFSNQDVDKLLEDIAGIKQVISRNRPVLREIFNLIQFRWFLMGSALIIIGFCVAIHLMVLQYGSFLSIPHTMRIILYVSMGLAAVILQIWKGRAYHGAVKRFDRNLTLGWAIKEFYSNQIAHVYITLVCLMYFFTAYFIIKGMAYYIIPSFSIMMGLISLCYGAMLQLRRGLLIGYWQLVTGLMVVIFPHIPAPIAVILTTGLGLLFLSLTGFVKSPSDGS